jgi:peptide deformylase
MAILKIARMGHPVLRQRAAEVPDPRAPEIQKLIKDMVETMDDAQGTGLAAPQVHVPLRVVVFKVLPTRTTGAEDDKPVGLTVLVNPVLEPLGEEKDLDWEGCLSVPGMMGAVPRFVHLRYRASTADGETIDRTVSGFHARVVQHECDHLDGVLYPQRIEDLRLFGFVEDMKKAFDDAGDPEME